ncbi:MAG: GNAT family N-acetyltransferase [Clostridia bacterium]|nr:GNAT family N-acetyltransferase [Clostridia bacterium]
MTNQDILNIAMRQSATDLSCSPDDFLRDKNITVISYKSNGARRYLELPFSCNLVSYGNNIVASVSKECESAVSDYINKFPREHCFETPNMNVLADKLAPLGQKLCFMAEYFLPDLSALKPLDCGYEIKLLVPDDFTDLYKPEWSNALCEKRRELDVIGIGAYDNRKLIALAAASADCDTMLQIGIDVLPEYRRKGIASALTSRLALKILEFGKVPFYCAAWSNIGSVRNAVKSGFRPAWVELTAKPDSFVDNMNR